MQETAQNVQSTVYRVQRTEHGVERSGYKVAGPKKRQHLKRTGGYLVCDEIRLSLEENIKTNNTEGICRSLETQHGRVLVDRFKKQAL